MSADRPTNSSPSTASRGRRLWLWLLLAVFLGGAGATWAGMHVHTQRLARRLLALPPDAVAGDSALLRFASSEARPLYATYCAGCHGADMHGNAALGAPNLTDAIWLYGEGSVYQVERTLLYGIRSGQSQGHDITDMPAFGLRGQLSADQIRSLVQFLLKLNGRPYQVAAAEDGRALYTSAQANCGDCHDATGRGNTDYGAPDLTANVWNNGGDPQSLYDSIYYGRHRMMPAWRGSLSLEQIRALAVYVHASSHE